MACWFFKYLFHLAKKKDTLISTIAGACVNMLFNFILIIPYGARGAAVATIIAEGTVYLILSIKMKKIL